MYDFSIVVEDLDLDNESQNAALEYLPYDVLVSSSGGLVSIDVECDTLSPSDSVMRVYEDLKKLGITPIRIDLDLVSLSEVASRVNSSRETVRLWSTGTRRSNFPSHFTTVGSSRLWAWAEVQGWLVSNDIEIDESYRCVPLPVDVVEAFNGAFAQNRDRSDQGWIPATSPSPSLYLRHTPILVARTGWKVLA